MKELLPGLYHAPNIHPLFVHFPIALWIAALLFLGLGALRQRDDLFRVGRWLLYLGLAGAAVSVGTGLWAAEKLGHDSPGHELVHVHRNWMLVASGLGALAAGVAFLLRKRSGGMHRWAIVAAMVIIVGVMTLGTDRGAELVFRYGVGTLADAPDSVEERHEHGEHGGANRPGSERPSTCTATPDAGPSPPDQVPRHEAPPEHRH